MLGIAQKLRAAEQQKGLAPDGVGHRNGFCSRVQDLKV
jgi:hypothetical protein